MRDTRHRTEAPGMVSGMDSGMESGMESVRRLVDQSLAAWEPAFTALDQAWSAWAEAAAGLGRPQRGRGRRHHHHDHDCRHDHDHNCDHCDCGCCTDGADVVVEARVGERRVLPVSLHNPRRRAVDVTLSLGEWTSCGDEAPHVSAEFDSGTSFTLAPCETRIVRLVLAVAAQRTGEDKVPGGDVRCCAVVTSDLRVEGCGTTSRIAVAVLPSDCGDLQLDCCGCGC